MTSSTQAFPSNKKHPWEDGELNDMDYWSPNHHDKSPPLRSGLIMFGSHGKNPQPPSTAASCPGSGIQVRMFMLTEMGGYNHRNSDAGMNRRCNISYNVAENFLSVCYTCNKRLDQEKDIYIYRGEMAFCSQACRCEVMTRDGLQLDDEDHARSQQFLT